MKKKFKPVFLTVLFALFCTMSFCAIVFQCKKNQPATYLATTRKKLGLTRTRDPMRDRHVF